MGSFMIHRPESIICHEYYIPETLELYEEREMIRDFMVVPKG